MNIWPFNLPTRWRVVVFLTVAYALNYADRSVFSSVLPALGSELHLSDRQLGLLGSVFLWSYALASPLAGVLADRLSRQRLVFVSLILWSAVTIVTGFAGGLLSLVVLRVALGLGESLYIPAAIALAADHHKTATRGKALSLMVSGLNIGVVLGGVAAGFLADHFGWRSSFLIFGLAGLAFALTFRSFLADGPVEPLAAPVPRANLVDALKYLARVPCYYILLLKVALAGIANWIFLSWLPLYFKESFSLTLAAAGFLGTFMLQGPSIVGTLAGGWFSDRSAVRDTRRRLLLHGCGYIVAAPFLLLFLLEPGLHLAVFAVAAFSLFRGFGGANEQPILCDVVPPRYRSTAVGLMNTFSAAVGGIGVFLAGVLKSTLGLNAVFGLLSLLFAIAAGILFLGYLFWARRDAARASLYDAPVVQP